jgi:hypothetical protein|uniref:Uncharacterized protein n=1 Tax=Picea glauca TaxID=3330 RepID=A0A117NHE6_PICGL|nr:hypothetical protein ABT39_MTgene5263 [Picea glauca]QHR88809.1 hypothetical protein Q903MT_gene2825 [Picea sitchensis]
MVTKGANSQLVAGKNSRGSSFCVGQGHTGLRPAAETLENRCNPEDLPVPPKPPITHPPTNPNERGYLNT